MSPASALPAAPDETARDKVRSDLGSTLFVEAGAGSGKTTALVKRVVELVERGEAELASIAAITFTEKAGAELRDRLRRTLEERLFEAGEGSLAGMQFRAAIDQLDGAAIGTLHSFAQRILMENPVEAGLPPRLEVLDEVSSDVAFDRRWQSFRDELLTDPVLEPSILMLLATGVRHEALRVLADTFEDNWDLVRDHVPADPPEPPRVTHLFADALALIDAVCERTSESFEWDPLCERLEQLAAYAERLRNSADEIDLVEQVAENKPSFKASGCGRAPNWQDKKSVVDDIRLAGEALDAAVDAVGQAAARRIATAMRAFTLRAADERRVSGELAFHDLLVLARSLLRDPDHGAAVRTRLHERYTRLLLDEFQDTDPIQIELATRIAAADPGSAEAGTAEWFELDLAPGHLFMVGDPKQSIYRFRRADISVFMAARDRFGGEGGGLVQLTANFRSCAPIIGWVNDTFGQLIGDGDDAGSIASQPPYIGLEAVRDEPPKGPSVSVVGRQPLDGVRADELREVEAKEVAATIARIVDEGWSVEDGRERSGWRKAALGDITILVPTRMSLPFLESELRSLGIAYRAESSSLVYVTQAVRDLLMTLRAVDDPTDHLRIVSALRTPLFACGDDDLFRFKREQGGHWGYTADQPDTVPPDDPVHLGLTYLRGLHDVRQWTSPSELLDRIARDRRAFEIGFAEGRPRDVWRRLRFVIDQAREWSESAGGSLRQYLQWVERQSHEGARVAEAVLPETDDDAVHIMTIHAAKGLQFPITIVSGMSTGARSQRAPAEVVFRPGREPGYRFGSKVVTDEFAEWVPIDEQMSAHERIRLLYVACTRAQDHLVVSLHRKIRQRLPEPDKRTNAELLVDGMADRLADVPDAVVEGAPAPTITRPAPPSAPLPFVEWEAERAAAIRVASRPSTIAATALTDEGGLDADGEVDAGLEKRPRDMDQPPWLKGRYGSAVGRAVHGVLQTVDLVTGDGVTEAVAAQCQAEAIPERIDDVTKLVGHALGSSIVEAAATAPHWREVYACTPTAGGRLLEGYIDLLYRTEDGLVVVDYKTAGTNDPARLDERSAGYRLQGASYAISVERATGERVARVAFLFLTPGGAVVIDLADLDQVKAEVERLVASGEEVVFA